MKKRKNRKFSKKVDESEIFNKYLPIYNETEVCGEKHPRVGHSCILKRGHTSSHKYTGHYGIWEWQTPKKEIKK